jgi:hypothetical protein
LSIAHSTGLTFIVDFGLNPEARQPPGGNSGETRSVSAITHDDVACIETASVHNEIGPVSGRPRSPSFLAPTIWRGLITYSQRGQALHVVRADESLTVQRGQDAAEAFCRGSTPPTRTAASPSPATSAATAVASAADAAISRLYHAAIAGGPIFAPLGEALTWLCSLDDLLAAADPAYRARRDAHPDGRVVPGLRWARNQAVHGETVVEMHWLRPGSGGGIMAGGLSGLGSVNSFTWGARAGIPPPGKPQPKNEATYDQYVAGHEFATVISPARIFLKAEAGVP